MRIYLRCKCWRAVAGKNRTDRVDGCKHVWHSGFKDRGVYVPIRTPFRKRLDAERYAEQWRANYFRRKHGLPTEPLKGDIGTARAADAATIADLQAQIADLKAELEALKSTSRRRAERS